MNDNSSSNNNNDSVPFRVIEPGSERYKEIMAQIEYEQSKIVSKEDKANQKADKARARLDRITSPGYAEYLSTYSQMAIKAVLKLLVFGGLVYFVLRDKINEGIPLTFHDIFNACSAAAFISLVLIVLIFFSKLFGNIIFGGIVSIFVILFIAEKVDVLLNYLNKTTETVDLVLGGVAIIYVLYNIIVFIYALKEYYSFK